MIKDILGLQDWDIPFLCDEWRVLPAPPLTDAESKGVLELIRADRLRRNGKVEYSPEAVLNSVVNNQRLSGIDARAWARERLATLKRGGNNGSYSFSVATTTRVF